MKEIWKKIESAYGYEVSDLGRVRSWRRKGSRNGSKLAETPRILKTKPNVHGYFVVNIARNCARQKPVAIHILVLTTFRGPCPIGMESLHNDGNKTNIKLSNLHWGTHAENMQDSARHGTTNKGEKNPRHILTLVEVSRIKKMLKIGKLTIRELGDLFKVDPELIRHISKGRSWKWVTGGEGSASK